MRLAVDAMGGDHAPREVVKGAIMATQEDEELEVVLVGDREQVEACIPDHLPSSVRSRLHICHAPDVIGPDEEPVRAIRRKKQSSLVVACEMVSQKEVDGMVTAGNTGAFMAAGLLIVGRIPGISRPALAPILPTEDNKGVLMLDGGANMDAKAEHLLQYAWMGDIYARHVLNNPKPRIGLLNVGTEEGKGNEMTKEVYTLLQELPLEFVGNVEARDVPKGVCDVLICDGFAGNILLKTMEGTAEVLVAKLKETLLYGGLRGKLGAIIIKPLLIKMFKEMDYAEYGGAPLLGVKGVMMKSHGSSEARAVKISILQGVQAVKSKLIQDIALRESSPRETQSFT